ncbi:NUDIX hydrolase [Paracoccus sp. Z330]|uniref:NUDIX hydrolase n=1 Tax=Paracoccus onchidii TaxID=3017813 RepID=A0ABT4ZHE6_9RHOB|nr:NUDIX hydrolase [Paracoccus onchidii]MDB6178783.1 NUDIX hydrolase [Paracoccus onchidii]
MTAQSSDFVGAKLCLTCDGHILTYLRDDIPDIPFPGHWDLPGGGREGTEPPMDCARRELQEEFGLHLAPARLRGRPFPSGQEPTRQSWLFSGNLTRAEIAMIRFGEEGQFWTMMAVRTFVTHPRSIPHFTDWIRATLG